MKMPFIWGSSRVFEAMIEDLIGFWPVKSRRKVVMGSRAAERRKMHSLGREPQDKGKKNKKKPRSGDRYVAPLL